MMATKRKQTLCGLNVLHGGSNDEQACKPFNFAVLALAERAIHLRLDLTAPHDKDGWVFAQCGGCDHFAAHDADWGICINPASPNFGKMTSEHTGCDKHSHFEKLNDAN